MFIVLLIAMVTQIVAENALCMLWNTDVVKNTTVKSINKIKAAQISN